MLPYFIFTEDIENFCQLMGFTVDDSVTLGIKACMYTLECRATPYVTTYNLGFITCPLIPPEKVLEYLTLMLNGYSYEDAVNELNVVG